METIVTYLLDKSPLLATVAITMLIVWWAAKFYYRMKRTESEIMGVKSDVSILHQTTDGKIMGVKSDIANVKTELKKDIASIKENDMYHLGKAMLLIGAEVMKNNPDRFERVKDTILETTPENRRDEIKAITL